eukprot:Trichotokara_eunicae@DN3985_c0_g1_i1.p1
MMGERWVNEARVNSRRIVTLDNASMEFAGLIVEAMEARAEVSKKFSFDDLISPAHRAQRQTDFHRQAFEALSFLKSNKEEMESCYESLKRIQQQSTRLLR